MPNDFQIIGSRGYVPTPEQVNRVRTFLKWLPTKTKPESVIVMPSDDFENMARAATRNPTEVSFSVGKRTYINADLFKPNAHIPSVPNAQLGGDDALEWTLAHEAAHMNSDLSPIQQEQRDGLFNDAANETMKHWNNPQGKAYRALQSNVSKAQGQIQPTQASIPTTLEEPPVRNEFSDVPYSAVKLLRAQGGN